MVEERRLTGGGGAGHAARWFARLLAAAAGVSGVVRYVLRPRPVPPPEAPPPHVGNGPLHPEIRYERTDTSFRWILGLLIAGGVLAVVIHVGLWWFFIGYRDHQSAVKDANDPLAAPQGRGLPPEPRLEQVDRVEGIERPDLAARQKPREDALDRYGPGEDGFVQIPIDRAMHLLAGKLPVRAKLPLADEARRAGGLVGSGESNSGRLFRERPR
jgi:hypothetical protein